MNSLTQTFGQLYMPVSALLIYRKNEGGNGSIFVEAFDIGKNGNPINAHPLTLKESAALAKALDVSEETNRNYMRPKGLLPENILYINPECNGFVIWHTPPQQAALVFTKDLTIENGKYHLPSLIWKADRNSLSVFAMLGSTMPDLDTPLCHAPFFNIYESGNVCMGTVKVDIKEGMYLEDFIAKWQEYFFNSKFSHLIQTRSPVKGNIVQLFQSLAGTTKKFPQKALIKNGLTLKNLIR